MIKRSLRYFAFLLLLILNNIFAGSSSDTALSVPSGFSAGPDIVAGNMADLEQFGAVGTQRGLATAITSCNAGDQFVGYFAIPNTDHPAMGQNLYRMSGGSSNNERFEQIGQSWVKHTYGAKQANSCNFGCLPGGDFTHLGVGCSDTYFSSQSAEQGDLGSRAWINPFTGVFPSNARDHTGHNHNAVSHMMVVESDDLNQTINAGATYYAELVYVTPDEYAWCQTHPGECNMANNASYLQYNVSGTTNFNFSQVGSPVRFIPAVNAWTGATIRTIEPAPGADGLAFLAYKVTGPVGGLYHYEYAIYNLNLDRGIQSFSVPRLLIPGAGEGIGPEQNVGFHGPPQHPGFPNDGTQGDAGFSAAEWTYTSGATSLTWNSETLAQNPNANAIRWGTLYNFRFDSTTEPATSNATVGFFKTGAPITVQIQGPRPIGGPSPTPTSTATPTDTPTATPTATPTPTPTPTVTPTPTGTPAGVNHALNLSTRLRVGTGNDVGIGGFIVTGTGPRHLLLRGIGPSLTGTGVTALADPVLELHGPKGFATITNDNWRDTQEAEIQATGIAPANDLESAILADLAPGAYTAILSGNGATVGVGLVEIYDLSTNTDSTLGNISTRAFVNTGDDIVIAGFILSGGSGEDPIIVRGLGPSLSGTGVNALADPKLELRNSQGTLILANDNWMDDPAQAAIISAAGLGPSNMLESAIAESLTPDAYTVLLSGVNNGTGVGLVEVYDHATSGPTPTPGGGTPTPTLPPPPGTCTENFDGVTPPALPPLWVASNPTPGDGVLWATSNVDPDTPPNDALIPDQDGISDKVLDRPNVTINTSNAMLIFRNNYNTEMSGGAFSDGGALEISSPNISNGDFLNFTDSEVGGSCVSGCYTCEITGGASGPSPAPNAWCGDSGGYIDTVINLGPNVSGQTITLRWRFRSDEAVAAAGWRIDGLSIMGASCP